MPVDFLDLTDQYRTLEGEITEAMSRVIESQRFILGAPVEALEEEIAEYVGVPHAVGCASGTDALLLVLRAMEPAEGDEVIVPSFTFFATAGAVWNAGFRPVFCDVDPDTFNVTRETVEEAWTDRTRGVIPVHLFGQMAPMEELNELARDRGAFVLEDAAQALGARQETSGGSAAWAQAGSLGDAGAFSFFPTKNLGGFGDGGMITTGNGALAETLRKLRVHGGRKMYHHEMVGTNSRLDALQAAVLRAKLPHLDGWAGGRRENAALYDELLAGVEWLRTPPVAAGNEHVYNQYTIRTEKRDALREHMNAREIGTGVYYPVPLHLQECFRELGWREEDLPVSERLSGEVLSLPVYPELEEAEIREVADAIREFEPGGQGSVH